MPFAYFGPGIQDILLNPLKGNNFCCLTFKYLNLVKMPFCLKHCVKKVVLLLFFKHEI